MRRLILRREAQNDIAAAHNHAFLDSDKRAQNLLDAVEEALQLIEAQPRVYALREEGVRRINLKGVSFALLFRFYEAGEVAGTGDEIINVVGLMHTSQDIGRFAARLTPSEYE